MSDTDSDSDIVKDLLVESYENLDWLDRTWSAWRKTPHDRDALYGVFRTIHTIKGTCGFLGLFQLEKVTHVGESLLTRLRDGQLTLNPQLTTALLDMVDAVRQMAAAGGALVTKRCATSGATSKRMQTAIFPMILTSCGGLPPRMTTSTKLGPTTSSILLAKRIAFPTALNSPVHPNNPEQSKAT
jgi:chemotaxis protein histidine kinase CheA